MANILLYQMLMKIKRKVFTQLLTLLLERIPNMELRPNRLLSYFNTKPLQAIVATLTTSSLLMLTSFSFSTAGDTSSTQACACDANVNYNSSLPSSHPNNRCAIQENDVSWKNWITGNSRSSQFHFIDLIELIYGHKDKPITDMPTSKNPEQI